MRWWKGFAIALVLLVILMAVAVWWAIPRPAIVTSARGDTFTLEGYQLSTNAVRYRFPKSVFDDPKLRWVPNMIRARFEMPVEKRSAVKPRIAGDDLLSCAVTVQVADATQGWWGRLAVADEAGNEFDPGGQEVFEAPKYEVLETSVFPRRGRYLKLRLKQDGQTAAEFRVRNPAYTEYPQWKPDALPSRATAGDLEVRLVDFIAERPKEYSGESYPSTRCVFELLQGGAPTTNWVPLRAEVLDATGNRLRPGWHDKTTRYAEGRLHFGFFGALWAGEDAWRLKFNLRQQSGFANEDLVRFEGLELPENDAVSRPRMIHEVDGARVELLGVFGQDVDRGVARKVFLNVYPRRGVMTAALRLELAADDRAFSFQGIYDGNGNPLQVTEVTRGPTAQEQESYQPVLIYFEAPDAATNVTLVFAIPKTRRVEFLAKPVQR